jgi:hypothetical protein
LVHNVPTRSKAAAANFKNLFTEPPRCYGTREKHVNHCGYDYERCRAVLVSGSGTLMTFLNAYDDFMQSVDVFMSALDKLEYLESLRDESGTISHWGVERVHGVNAARNAYGRTENEICGELLRTPLASLWQAVTRAQPGRSLSDRLGILHAAVANLGIVAPEKTAHLQFIGLALQESSASTAHRQE